MEQKNNDGFSYTYSAREQAEIRVTQKAQTVALILGILGSLILGCGMSLIMSDLGAILNLDPLAAMLVGIPVGVGGGILVALAYPVYHLIVKRERKKIAPEILRLTDELMK